MEEIFLFISVFGVFLSVVTMFLYSEEYSMFLMIFFVPQVLFVVLYGSFEEWVLMAIHGVILLWFTRQIVILARKRKMKYAPPLWSTLTAGKDRQKL